MNIETKTLLFFFIFFSPFTSAFSLSGTINLPVIFGSILFLYNILLIFKSQKISNQYLTIETRLTFLFLFFVVISYLLNGLAYQFSLNHTAAYISSFLLFFLSPLYTFLNIKLPNDGYKFILKWVFITVAISSIFSVIEFGLTNFFSITVSDFIPRSNVKDYDPLAIGFLIRSRGFAEESGHYAFMIELFAPLAIFYLYKSGLCKMNKFYKFIFTFCIILSILTSFSVASFIIIPISITLYFIYNIKNIFIYWKAKFLKVIFIFLAVFVLWEIINLVIPLSQILELTISDKLDSSSSYDRAFRSNFFWSTFPHLPLINILCGVGPSGFRILGYDDSYSFLSLFQTITFETGLIGISIIVIMFFSLLVKIIQCKNIIQPYLFIAFFSGLIHYTSISNYWYPWFWILCCIIIFIHYRKKDIYATN